MLVALQGRSRAAAPAAAWPHGRPQRRATERSTRRPKRFAVTNAQYFYDYAGQDPINGYDLSGAVLQEGQAGPSEFRDPLSGDLEVVTTGVLVGTSDDGVDWVDSVSTVTTIHVMGHSWVAVTHASISGPEPIAGGEVETSCKEDYGCATGTHSSSTPFSVTGYSIGGVSRNSTGASVSFSLKLEPEGYPSAEADMFDLNIVCVSSSSCKARVG